MTGMGSMSSFVSGFQDIDRTIPIASGIKLFGGKALNLVELTRIEGIHVPDGFCISTKAFKTIIGELPSINELLDELSLLKIEDQDKIAELSKKIRRVIQTV